MDRSLIDEIATEVSSVSGSGLQVTPFSSRHAGFTLADAYQVGERLRDLRAAQGDMAVGRKIGFTNQTVWANYGISGPIWSYLYRSSVKDLAALREPFPLAGLAEPRIEPEIVLHLARSPWRDMSDTQLLDCIDWFAHGFEVVESIFPGWAFGAADAVAARGVHVALLLGERRPVIDGPACADALRTFSIELLERAGTVRRGRGQDVLGGPLEALRFLMREIDLHPGSDPLAAGEIVTTGTLTEAMPALAGAIWTTALNGIDLDGLRLQFA
jgi:2-oxo-3-hexenedioate decarboxylase